jgi:hypothetical protein
LHERPHGVVHDHHLKVFRHGAKRGGDRRLPRRPARHGARACFCAVDRAGQHVRLIRRTRHDRGVHQSREGIQRPRQHGRAAQLAELLAPPAEARPPPRRRHHERHVVCFSHEHISAHFKLFAAERVEIAPHSISIASPKENSRYSSSMAFS